MNREQLKKTIRDKTPEAHLEGVEYKSTWDRQNKNLGKSISGIANDKNISLGWLVIGVNKDGEVCSPSCDITQLEEVVSQHILDYLEPSYAVKSTKIEEIEPQKFCIFIEINDPQEVVYWNNKAYIRNGTVTKEMKPGELTQLSLKLPGTDFSKRQYNGNYDPPLVTSFAESVCNNNRDIFDFDTKNNKPNEILKQLNIFETNTAGILFGDFPYRVVNFNSDGDILKQRDEKGLWWVFSKDFIEYLQSTARTKGTNLQGGSAAVGEETPYPIKALREALANAVAHSLYQENNGDIVVETHPNKVVIRNNCKLEAKAFVNKWLSRKHKATNKHLMSILRLAGVTDEQGTGKIKLFRLMIESGKREPIVGFEEYNNYGRWVIALYNEETNLTVNKIAEEVSEHFPDKEHRRIAVALLLWRSYKLDEIKAFMDKQQTYLLDEVLKNDYCPVAKDGEGLSIKRWAKVRLEGALTKPFTEAEKNRFYKLLQEFCIKQNTEGLITSDEIRKQIGLLDTDSEKSQAGNLAGQWRKEGKVEKIAKSQWKFIKLHNDAN